MLLVQIVAKVKELMSVFPTIWPALFTPKATELVAPVMLGKAVIGLPFDEVKARLPPAPLVDCPTT